MPATVTAINILSLSLRKDNNVMDIINQIVGSLSNPVVLCHCTTFLMFH